jgi:hypothetical protein
VRKRKKKKRKEEKNKKDLKATRILDINRARIAKRDTIDTLEWILSMIFITHYITVFINPSSRYYR